MKKALITGGSGFVGQHLARELKGQGYEVYSFDRGLPVEDNSLYKDSYEGDLLNLKSLSKVILGLKPEVIFHLAAQASAGLSFKKPQLTFEVNVIGTINLFEVVQKEHEKVSYNPQIVVAGSADSYGKVEVDNLPITEETTFNPTNPYAVSKIGVEYLAKVYVKAYGMTIITAIPFNHSGPGQREGFFIPDMCVQIAKIEQGIQKPKILTGRLDVSRDISDVRDIVRGYRLLAEKGTAGEEYVLCSGKGVQMEELLNKLLEMSEVKIKHKFDQSRMRPVDFPVIYGSYDKARKKLGWEPEIGIEQTLEDTLEWYRNNYLVS